MQTSGTPVTPETIETHVTFVTPLNLTSYDYYVAYSLKSVGGKETKAQRLQRHKIIDN
jgi:hypothetical protein